MCVLEPKGYSPLGVSATQVVLKVVKVDEITKGVVKDREKKKEVLKTEL